MSVASKLFVGVAAVAASVCALGVAPAMARTAETMIPHRTAETMIPHRTAETMIPHRL